jgi:hypothetical protein
VELVTGTVRISQSEPVEAQDAFPVREEHLDLLADRNYLPKQEAFPRAA